MCVRPDREGIDDLAKDRRTYRPMVPTTESLLARGEARGLIPYPGMKESSEVRHVA
jgi:hypothetical protein